MKNTYSAASPARDKASPRGGRPGQNVRRGAEVRSARNARPASRRPGRGWLGSADHRYTLIQLGLVIALIVFSALLLGSSGTKDVPFDRIAQAMAAAPGVQALSEKDANALQDRFGVAPDLLSGWLLYGGDSVMDVSELLIAHSADAAALDRLEAGVTERLGGQLESFRNYGTNQVDLLEHAIVLRKGPYLFYGVSEAVDQWESKFLACVR